MAKASPKFTLLLFISFLLLTPPPPTSALLYFTQFRTALSLSHSLLSRVAVLRTARGDLDGARRVQIIASMLDHGLSLRFFPTLWSMRNYQRIYSWRDTMPFRDAMGLTGDLNEFLSSLTELTRLSSNSQRAWWVARNYENILRGSKAVFNRLPADVFSQSGPLREMVEILQKEMEGEFLKDCLEVGSNDLRGLTQILKNLASQYSNVDDPEDL